MIDARMIEGVNISEIPKAAVIAGYTLKRNTSYAVGFVSNKEQSKEDKVQPHVLTEAQIGTEPTIRNPLEWFAWCKGNGYQYSQEMINFVVRNQNVIDNENQGSIGTQYKSCYAKSKQIHQSIKPNPSKTKNTTNSYNHKNPTDESKKHNHMMRNRP